MQHMQSMLLPWLVQAALKRGRPGLVGPGKNVWPHVEVNDSEKYYLTAAPFLLVTGYNINVNADLEILNPHLL